MPGGRFRLRRAPLPPGVGRSTRLHSRHAAGARRLCCAHPPGSCYKAASTRPEGIEAPPTAFERRRGGSEDRMRFIIVTVIVIAAITAVLLVTR